MDYPQQHIKSYSGDGRKTERVERMFDNIVHVCDKLNHVLSLDIDRSQRRKAIAWLRPFRLQHIMDVATGIGDFAILACREPNLSELIRADTSEGMMSVDYKKVKKEGLSDKTSLAWGDCTPLSFIDSRFDAITVAFGIHSFEDLDKDLSGMCRVLKPGEHLVILELTAPDRFPIRQLLVIYLKVVIPLLNKFFSRDNSAYHYPPDTVKVFPQGEVMRGVISKTGLGEVHFRRLAFGICTFYTAIKQ